MTNSKFALLSFSQSLKFSPYNFDHYHSNSNNDFQQSNNRVNHHHYGKISKNPFSTNHFHNFHTEIYSYSAHGTPHGQRLRFQLWHQKDDIGRSKGCKGSTKSRLINDKKKTSHHTRQPEYVRPTARDLPFHLGSNPPVSTINTLEADSLPLLLKSSCAQG